MQSSFEENSRKSSPGGARNRKRFRADPIVIPRAPKRQGVKNEKARRIGEDRNDWEKNSQIVRYSISYSYLDVRGSRISTGRRG